MADPANRLIEHFAERELQTIPTAHIAHHGKSVAVRSRILGNPGEEQMVNGVLAESIEM